MDEQESKDVMAEVEGRVGVSDLERYRNGFLKAEQDCRRLESQLKVAMEVIKDVLGYNLGIDIGDKLDNALKKIEGME
jgi:hypothetical protein